MYQAFFFLLLAAYLLVSCSLHPQVPQEDLQFVNGKVNIVTKSVGTHIPTTFGLVDILWDSQGNLILAGNFPKDEQHRVCIAGQSRKIELIPTLPNCSFVAKLSPGTVDWVFVQDYHTFAVAVDQTNSVVVASENALFKLSPTGQTLWQKPMVDANILRIAVDAESNIFVSGQYQNNAKFGDFLFRLDVGLSETFFSKLDRDGNRLWVESKSSNAPTPFRYTMAVDREGNIALVTRNKKNFTGKHISIDDLSRNYVAIAKLDKDKNHIWITAVDNFIKHLST